MTNIKHQFYLILSIFFWITPSFAEVKYLPVGDDIEFSVDIFDGAGETLFMFFPHEYSMGEGYIDIANSLSGSGYDFWAVDIHESYMTSGGKNSLQYINFKHIMSLINQSKKAGFKNIILVSTSRSAQLSLRIAREWQISNLKSNYIKGHIFHSPHLIKDSYTLGDEVEYLDLARSSNLPVYAIYPEFDTKYRRALEISDILSIGGSSVFSHKIKGVRGGFHIRNDKDIEKIDLETRRILPNIYMSANKLFESVEVGRHEVGISDNKIGKKHKPIKKMEAEKNNFAPFQIYKGDQDLRIDVEAYDGGVFNLNRGNGKVILLNFWASWCGPCVKEIPSLMRLKDILKNRDFEIVTVNVGESQDKIKAFKEYVDFDLPIAMDIDGNVIRDWKVYAYPSNFVLNKNGRIALSLKGAVEWDESNIVDTISRLLKE